MATITKLPTAPVEAKKAVCDCCRCEFSFGKHEVCSEHTLLDGGWAGIGITYRVKCPNCGYLQRVGTDYLPPK